MSAVPTVAGDRLIRLLCASTAQARFALTIFGRCLDDRSIGSFPEVTVTGPVASRDLPVLALSYNIGCFVSAERWGGFLEIETLARLCSLPTAFFDWSFGLMPQRQDDLHLDPRICDAKAVRNVLRWLDHLPGHQQND